MTADMNSARPKLLVVDDEPEILVALADLFEEDFDVLRETSPVRALALLEANPDVAVIVSDQRMPEMQGNVLLARARRFTDADAILLTGYADLSAVISAINEGAIAGYIHKPWEPEALRAMVHAAVERHRLRRQLAFERAGFMALLDGSGDMVSVLDRDGRVLRSNAEDVPPDPEDAAADSDALTSGRYSEAERVFTEGDARRWVRTRRIPFGADSDRHLLKIVSDETDRRVAEQKIHQAEKLQALGTLAGGIAHDFNNLLAVILGNLELARRSSADPARLDRYLANANDAASRGSAISRRLLTFSRQRDLAAETFLPARAIREVEDIIVRSMAGRVTLRYAMEDDVWPVRTDPSQFELAIINLCINARDAMPSGGEIEIAARNAPADALPADLATGDYVHIAVSDTGTGMSDEVKRHVFEPFFTTKPRGEGTGLGLPMVRAMAEAAGGCALVDSVEGEGTTIGIWLPRAETPVDAMIAPPTASELPKLRILLAEDDSEVREMLSEHLLQAGHAIVARNSGEEALALLADDSAFDLLITDFAMPRLSGLELARIVADRWSELPVLLVTGFAEMEADLPQLMVLTKPFTDEQLRIALARAVHIHR